MGFGRGMPSLTCKTENRVLIERAHDLEPPPTFKTSALFVLIAFLSTVVYLNFRSLFGISVLFYNEVVFPFINWFPWIL